MFVAKFFERPGTKGTREVKRPVEYESYESKNITKRIRLTDLSNISQNSFNFKLAGDPASPSFTMVRM